MRVVDSFQKFYDRKSKDLQAQFGTQSQEFINFKAGFGDLRTLTQEQVTGDHIHMMSLLMIQRI